MNTLLINTANNQEVKIGLRINNKDHWIRKKIDTNKAQVVLPLIDKVLEEKGIHLSDLDNIEVNVNMGSFTGVRVGLSIANALGYVCKLPVKKVLY